MKIYELVEYDTNVRCYFFATKTAAEQKQRELKAEAEGYEIEIRLWTIDPTRDGIARALNDLIDITCHNEG